MNARRGTVAVVAFGALLLLWSLRGPSLEPTVLENDAPASSPVSPPLEPATPPETAEAAPAPQEGPLEVEVRSARLIDRIEFVPDLPCEGEQVQVVTHLRSDAEDAKVFVNGQPGSPQIVVAGAAGRQTVRILARGWNETLERRQELLSVRHCPDAPSRLGANIVTERLGDRRYAFALRPAAAEVQWEFGDGAEAFGASVEHGYPARADRPHSTYIVRARFEGPSGPETALHAITHVEVAGMAAQTAFPIIESDGPRFVEWNPGAPLQTRRLMRNELPEAVRFEVASVRAFPCNGGSAEALQLPADEVMDLQTLRPGEEAEVGLRFDPDRFSSAICEMSVELVGQSGRRITTSEFSLDTGTPDRIEPIEDEQLLATIAAIAAEREDPSAPITAEDIAAHRLGRP